MGDIFKKIKRTNAGMLHFNWSKTKIGGWRLHHDGEEWFVNPMLRQAGKWFVRGQGKGQGTERTQTDIKEKFNSDDEAKKWVEDQITAATLSK